MSRYDTQKLDLERLRRGWSRTKLARLADLSPTDVTRVLNGKNLNPEKVKKLADVLSVSMDELIIEEVRAERGQPAA